MRHCWQTLRLAKGVLVCNPPPADAELPPADIARWIDRALAGPDYARLREFKAMHVTFDWIGRFGAHSVGIGRKQVDKKRTGTLALRVYVERKQRLTRRPSRIPKRASGRSWRLDDIGGKTQRLAVLARDEVHHRRDRVGREAL